ncbi:MAG: hypothetical protein QNJ00_16290 [Woeseiaceae bacterium]|nr:hypothetical protein [Woeseiaceae bacterium]
MEDLANQIKEKAELAVSQFEERSGGRLDYSPASLDVIDEMLREASDFSNDMPPDQINALVKLMGSYVLHVGFVQHGGVFYWSDEQQQPVLVVGEPDFRIAIMTFGKVRGRLLGDEGDNISFFYVGFSDRIRDAEPGVDALYI